MGMQQRRMRAANEIAGSARAKVTHPRVALRRGEARVHDAVRFMAQGIVAIVAGRIVERFLDRADTITITGRLDGPANDEPMEPNP